MKLSAPERIPWSQSLHRCPSEDIVRGRFTPDALFGHVDLEEATNWFARVLTAISDECEGDAENEGDAEQVALSDVPPTCRHVLPAVTHCIGKIKYLKNIAYIYKTMSDQLVSHAASRLSG